MDGLASSSSSSVVSTASNERALKRVRAAGEPPTTTRYKPPPPKPPVRTSAKRIKVVKPGYTVAANRAGVEGEVILLVTIAKDGTVTAVKVIKGLGYGLDEAAMAAAKKWVYEPATLDGKPVRSKKRQKVQFILED